MKMKRLNGDKPNFAELYKMLEMMENLLDEEDTDLTLEEVCSFQETDGSFSLLDTTKIPNEAVIDFINQPTHICISILMKEYLKGSTQVKKGLIKGLNYTFQTGLRGHGYEAEKILIRQLKVFIKGGLLEFLENKKEICPRFHCMIHNIIHQYNYNLINNKTLGPWREDYQEEWEKLAMELKPKTRFYLAYGSNMNKEQMFNRCPDAKVVGKSYLEDWELTMPSHANIEPAKGKKTPVLIWEISERDEKNLDRYEGYPNSYDKKELVISVGEKELSAMAYVMTVKRKSSKWKVGEEYLAAIIQGYEDAGFEKAEFKFREDI